jgi:hypothetical protein
MADHLAPPIFSKSNDLQVMLEVLLAMDATNEILFHSTLL